MNNKSQEQENWEVELKELRILETLINGHAQQIKDFIQKVRDESYEEGLKEQARIEKVGIEEIRAGATAELKEKIIKEIEELKPNLGGLDNHDGGHYEMGFEETIKEAIEIIKKIR